MTVTTAKETKTQGRIGGVEYFVVGEGLPVTVFAHGLGGSISETRPLSTDVEGTKVFIHFRGHGDSDDIQGWDYDSLASDLRAVSDQVNATRAVGVSMGAGALLKLISQTPDRFERLVFVMPAALTHRRSDGAIVRLEIMAEAARAGDEATIKEMLLAEVPEGIRSERIPQLLAARRAREIAGKVPPAAADGEVRPLSSLALLRDVSAPALVLAQQEDFLHPAELAQQLADALPNVSLEILEPGGIYWTDAQTARSAIANHINGELQ